MGLRKWIDKFCSKMDGGKPYSQIIQELHNEIDNLKISQNKDINLILTENERLHKEINEQKKTRLKLEDALTKSKEEIVGLENENKKLYRQLREQNEYIPNNIGVYNEDCIIQFIIRIIQQSSLLVLSNEKTKDDTLFFYNEKLEELLTLMNVEVINQVGIKYNSKFAKIVSTIEVEDDNLVDCIAESIDAGFMKDGKVIKPQEVIIYCKKMI